MTSKSYIEVPTATPALNNEERHEHKTFDNAQHVISPSNHPSRIGTGALVLVVLALVGVLANNVGSGGITSIQPATNNDRGGTTPEDFGLKARSLLSLKPVLPQPMGVYFPPSSHFDLERMCAIPDEDCFTEESYQQCLGLIQDGCKDVGTTYSCPPSYHCIDDDDNDNANDDNDDADADDDDDDDHDDDVDEGDLSAAGAFCPPPLEDNDDNHVISCHTPATYQQCLDLAQTGCKFIASYRSCPTIFICMDA